MGVFNVVESQSRVGGREGLPNTASQPQGGPFATDLSAQICNLLMRAGCAPGTTGGELLIAPLTFADGASGLTSTS